jgi:predicted metal-dependent hydrolase
LGVRPLQQIFDFAAPTAPQADHWVEVEGEKLPAYFRHNRRARHYLLYLRRDRSLRVTLPPRGTRKEARQFIESKIPWIQRQLKKLSAEIVPARSWLPGDTVPLHGKDHPIRLSEKDGALVIRLDSLIIHSNPGQADLRPLIESSLQKYAGRILPPRVRSLAEEHGWKPGRITVRNQSSRWGSCSERGTISLNWRLVQVPPAVCDYVILHELCHLDHLNHSSAFWKALANVCPRHREHENWLKANAVKLGL